MIKDNKLNTLFLGGILTALIILIGLLSFIFLFKKNEDNNLNKTEDIIYHQESSSTPKSPSVTKPVLQIESGCVKYLSLAAADLWSLRQSLNIQSKEASLEGNSNFANQLSGEIGKIDYCINKYK